MFIDLGLPGDYFPVLCPLLTPLRLSSTGSPVAYPVARDTLAFGYKIPAITALFGLGGVYPRTIEIYYMPGTPILNLLRRIRRRRSSIEA
ncbi:MAG: hypothetical protein M0Q51_17115 [Bacteroidales bacterium]|nr:hypothetical protein [Bacteroidales bacterium]